MQQPVGQRFARWLPTLFNWIKFRSVKREIHDSECPSVGFQKGCNLAPPVPGGAVNYQEHPAPPLAQNPQKPHKAFLGLPLAE